MDDNSIIDRTAERVGSETLKVTVIREQFYTKDQLLSVKAEYESELIKIQNLLNDINQGLDLLEDEN